MSTVSKIWDFTLNNYIPVHIETLESWTDEVNKMVVAKEIAETGIPHLQGRITFKRAYRLKVLKKLLNAHWEPIKVFADSFYCKKADFEIIFDVNNVKFGRRTDIELALDDISTGVFC